MGKLIFLWLSAPPFLPLFHLTPFQLWDTHPGCHSQILYFRSSSSRPSNFSAMHQQEEISCKNIYLSGIVLYHLHGVVPLSNWGVRWLGLGPPAVFDSYRSLHTLPSDKLMPWFKNPLSQWPLRSTHCFFPSPKFCLELWSTHDFSPITFYISHSICFSSYKDKFKKGFLNATLKLEACPLLPGLLVFIIVYI